ncbi:MAG TPA: hypothetical protein VM715_04765 [Candidatus Acidoferrum sp.]|jgi:argininosuccinate lyase|nr:hypothetical protein [Candidatus Acidoferrum sp.]
MLEIGYGLVLTQAGTSSRQEARDIVRELQQSTDAIMRAHPEWQIDMEDMTINKQEELSLDDPTLYPDE